MNNIVMRSGIIQATFKVQYLNLVLDMLKVHNVPVKYECAVLIDGHVYPSVWACGEGEEAFLLFQTPSMARRGEFTILGDKTNDICMRTIRMVRGMIIDEAKVGHYITPYF